MERLILILLIWIVEFSYCEEDESIIAFVDMNVLC